MRSRRRSIAALCALAAILVVAPASAQTSAAPAPAAAPADLKDAQAKLSRAATPSEYAAMLDTFSTALSPSDALALLDQGIGKVEPSFRRKLLVKAADLDLLVGLFGDAAARYEAAAAASSTVSASATTATAAADQALILRAARCYIASGDSEKAAALSADLLAADASVELANAARLVGAWALAMQGRKADAALLAAAVAGSSKSVPSSGSDKPGAVVTSSSRREAEFLLWLCAEAGSKAAAAAALVAEFPSSPEALIASGSASAPPLPHWYLGGLGAMQEPKRPGAAPSNAQSAAASLPAAAPSATPSPSAAPATAASDASALPAASRGKRLQVGYFSREDNAQALKEELSSKGFAAAVELRLRPARATVGSVAAPGTGAAAGSAGEEKRWIVVVDGKDLVRTAQTLKDAGYESYVID